MALTMRPLSPRQHECVELMRQGLCNKRIARQLGISDRTVQAHLYEAYGKGVRARRPSMQRRGIA